MCTTTQSACNLSILRASELDPQNPVSNARSHIKVKSAKILSYYR